MSHSGTLNKVRNFEAAMERAGNTVLANVDPVETMRTVALASTIHDDVFNYPAPSDFKKPIDLYPQDTRSSSDTANREFSEQFDLQKMISDKNLTIEGNEGSKLLRINWRSRKGKTLHTMNSVTENGIWSAVGSASGIQANSIFKVSGSASIEFDLVASNDGIQNTTMNPLDLTDEDEVADVFVPIYFGSGANSVLVTAIWGNDLTTNYWTWEEQYAQADGSDFRNGWNLLKFPWSEAIETGTVDPATIDSFKIIIEADPPINNIRVDNIMFSIGRNFDLKYYSKYLLKNTAGTWISKTSSDDDTVVLDNDGIQLFLLEGLKACAQQTEGEDSSFDINYANRELHGDPSSPDPDARIGLYAKYRREHPSQAKKAVARYSSGPRFRR